MELAEICVEHIYRKITFFFKYLKWNVYICEQFWCNYCGWGCCSLSKWPSLSLQLIRLIGSNLNTLICIMWSLVLTAKAKILFTIFGLDAVRKWQSSLSLNVYVGIVISSAFDWLVGAAGNDWHLPQERVQHSGNQEASPPTLRRAAVPTAPHAAALREYATLRPSVKTLWSSAELSRNQVIKPEVKHSSAECWVNFWPNFVR